MLKKKDENALQKLFQPIVGVRKQTRRLDIKPRGKAMQQKALQSMSRMADWHFYYIATYKIHIWVSK